MDIEKLIEQLSARGLGNGTSLGYHSGLLDEAATALSTLQVENQALRNAANGFKAENEKLRAELEQKSKLLAKQAAELERRDKLLKERETELERVKRERSAAVDDLETIMFVGGQNTDTCMYCKNARCYDRGGSQLCSPQWRGQRKEN